MTHNEIQLIGTYGTALIFSFNLNTLAETDFFNSCVR